MVHAFRNILVPVDFTINTEVALAKALELIDQKAGVVHLLHVLPCHPFFARKSGADRAQHLQDWSRRILQQVPTVTVQQWIVQAAPVQKVIRQTAVEVKADLIVIGQSASHFRIPLFKTVGPMQLNEQTGIPVLTAKPGALHNKTKIVVVPITGQMPEPKLRTLEILCGKERPTIHLIAPLNDRNEPSPLSASALLQTFQWLKTSLHCPVEYAVVHGQNKAKAILEYAGKMNADILLVQPELETKLGWGNTHIPDVLPAVSKVQVLAVQPF